MWYPKREAACVEQRPSRVDVQEKRILETRSSKHKGSEAGEYLVCEEEPGVQCGANRSSEEDSIGDTVREGTLWAQ